MRVDGFPHGIQVQRAAVANTNTLQHYPKISIKQKKIQKQLQIQMRMDSFPLGNSSALCSGNCKVTTQHGN